MAEETPEEMEKRCMQEMELLLKNGAAMANAYNELLHHLVGPNCYFFIVVTPTGRTAELATFSNCGPDDCDKILQAVIADRTTDGKEVKDGRH